MMRSNGELADGLRRGGCGDAGSIHVRDGVVARAAMSAHAATAL
jgi:hypothetical protein